MNFQDFYKFTIVKFINFKYRKYVHYSLLISIILFQFLLALFIYNEFYNVNELEKINLDREKLKKAEVIIQNTSSHFSDAQNDFISFLTNKNDTTFNGFQKNMNTGMNKFDTLNNKLASNSGFTKYFKENNKEEYKNYQVAKKKIDSLRKANPLTNTNGFKDLLDVKNFDYNQILNSVKVDTKVEVDSIKKKGFFGRLGNAISGDVEVQKEKVNVVVSMKFGKNVSSGNVQQQLGQAFNKTNEYYQEQIKNLKIKLSLNKNSETELLLKSFDFLENSHTALKAINSSFISYKNAIDKKYNKKEAETKSIRRITVFGIIILVLLVSIILIILTRLAFGYEKRLLVANKTIQENLIFKDKLVSMISHEIRTPLSIISLYSIQLKDKIVDPIIKQLFESITFTTNSANLLASQILEFSKNEQKKIVLKPSNFNVKNELNEVLNGLKSLVELKNNTLDINLDLPDDLNVTSDVVKMYQVFYNLIGNANKFTEKGTILVQAKTVNSSPKYCKLEVTISDTGKGIKQEDITAIFNNFYQSVAEEKVHNLGAGLGLYLCKELIELFDGEIFIESKINMGTKVKFSLQFLK